VLVPERVPDPDADGHRLLLRSLEQRAQVNDHDVVEVDASDDRALPQFVPVEYVAVPKLRPAVEGNGDLRS
jgi:hypothetical protein